MLRLARGIRITSLMVLLLDRGASHPFYLRGSLGVFCDWFWVYMSVVSWWAWINVPFFFPIRISAALHFWTEDSFSCICLGV
ncbi:hypothetical protein V8F06_010735 [Rhypophila decipiens]